MERRMKWREEEGEKGEKEGEKWEGCREDRNGGRKG